MEDSIIKYWALTGLLNGANECQHQLAEILENARRHLQGRNMSNLNLKDSFTMRVIFPIIARIHRKVGKFDTIKMVKWFDANVSILDFENWREFQKENSNLENEWAMVLVEQYLEELRNL